MTNYRKKLLWLYARKRGSGSGGISVSVSGTTPVTLANAIESAIRHMTQFGKLTQSGTPTTANPVDIVCNNGALKWDSENRRIYADGTPEVLTVSADDVADQTASVENLLAVGNVRDEQDIITGKVIRRTEAFVYDGTQTVKPTFMSTTGAATEGAIIVQPRGAEYAGDVVSFEAEEGKNIDSLKVTLTPKQEGTGDPSPDNIRPITGTEQAEVVQRGINLWDEEWESGGIYPTNGEPRTDANAIRSKNFIPVSAGKTYYGYIGASGVQLYIAYWNGDSYLSGGDRVDNRTFTVPTGATKAKIWTYGGTYSTYANDISINYPATDTAYHAYDPQSTTLEVEWGADVGTIYGGSVDVTNGVLTVDRAMVDFGSLVWNYNTTYAFFTSNFISTRKIGVLNVWSDLFKTMSGSWSGTPAQNALWGNGSNTTLYVQIPPLDNVNDFMALVDGHQLMYELATPITIPIDPQTLTALRNNTVWSDEGSVDVLLNDELVETVAKQPLRTAEGDNTVSVVSEVGEVELAVTYKGGSE